MTVDMPITTLEISAHEVSWDGNIQACVLEYDGVGPRQPLAGKDGVGVRGHFEVYRDDTAKAPKLAGGLLLEVTDFIGQGRTQAIPPDQLQLVTSNGKLVPGRKGAGKHGGTPGSYAQVFDHDEQFRSVYQDIAERKQLGITFRQASLGTPARFFIDLTVKSVGRLGAPAQRTDQMVTALMACVRKLEAR